MERVVHVFNTLKQIKHLLYVKVLKVFTAKIDILVFRCSIILSLATNERIH